MSISNIDISIVVNGVEVPVYDTKDGKFIEGRKGSEFLIRIKNRTHQRKLIVPSVDGISTIDGDRATVDSSGYVVSPYGTLDIPGWTVDKSTVAKFTFGGKGESYASQINADIANIGVIGIAAYAEKVRETPKTLVTDYYDYWKHNNTGYPSRRDNIIWSTVNKVTSSNVYDNTYDSATLSASSASTGNLGTEFGKASDFKVTSVDFERGHSLGVEEFFYDDRVGLQARGIVIVQTAKPAKPSAFGSTNCIPPKNWKR